MRFVQPPKYADPREAVERILEIAMAAPRDSKGWIAVAHIEKVFRGEGAIATEYAQAMTTVTQERRLNINPAGTHVTFIGVNKLA